MMTIAIKPTWNPATVSLTGIAAVISWPLALPVAAYAIWGEKLAGPEGSFDTARHTVKSWFGGKGKARSARPQVHPAAQEYRKQRFEELKAEQEKVEAEVAAYADDQHEKKLAADREAFDRFMAGRNAQSH